MDAYGEKLNQMKGYIPFLNKMISKLERAGDPSKDTQVTFDQNLSKETQFQHLELYFFLFSCQR